MPDTTTTPDAQRLAAAVLAHEWTPGRNYTAHANHAYHYDCGVCLKDVGAIVGVVLGVQGG